MAIKIGINGFGRIGRLVFKRLMLEKEFKDYFDIVGINDLMPTKLLAHLLKYDSVHGKFPMEVSYTEDSIVVGGEKTKVFSEKDPSNLKWGDLGAEIILESTGFFRTHESASLHLKGGAKKVIISAPAKGDKGADNTIVMGVNEDTYVPDKHHILSNASCTTNCLAPVAKVLNDNFKIQKGLMTTIHAYTNDQQVLDGPHKDFRRARAAALSMIPTTTGAAKAVGLVLPELNGLLDGFAIRVPTPDVSVVDLVVTVEKKTTAQEVNNAMKKAAADGPMKGYLAYTEVPCVTVDYTGDPASSIFDALSTKVIDGDMIKVLSFYDNEWGYACRCVDLMKYISEKK